MNKFVPILFSTPMVRAILSGKKTQTRRVCKFGKAYIEFPFEKYEVESEKTIENMLPCKYKIGDILWVRETWQNHCIETKTDKYTWAALEYSATGQYVYCADNYELPKNTLSFSQWKPSIHMPKSACRIFLDVINLKLERLQEISEPDAIAEGVIHLEGTLLWYNYIENRFTCSSAVESYQSLWQKINGIDSWDLNPWVWAVEFKEGPMPDDFI